MREPRLPRASAAARPHASRPGGRPAVAPSSVLPALACAALTAIACTPAGPRGAAPPGRAPAGDPAAPAAGAPGPAVAVGLRAGAEQVTVEAGAPLLLGEAEGGGDTRVRTPCVARPAGGGRVEVRCEDGARLTTRASTARFRAPGASPLRVDGRVYDGEIVLRAAGDGLTVINTLALESYLLGVVPHEIGARPPAEIDAVKAQAVAARTYAVAHRGRRRALGFDYWADSNDQVYRGLEGQDTVSARAVRETRGEVLTYGGQPILAYYHSTCGGRTAAIDEVWRAGPLPYLRSVSDLDARGRAWCESSNRFRWRERWEWGVLGAILERSVGLDADAFRGLRIRGRTHSGRVAALEIEGAGGSLTVYGDSVRWALRREGGAILNSARIDEIREGGDADGSRWIEVSGGGWGHGIGMCQVGAMARARFGQDYRRILGAYYPGTELERVY